MSWYYIQSEPQLWTVGIDDGKGEWNPESNYDNEQDAAARVIELNGGGNANTTLTLKLIEGLQDICNEQHKQIQILNEKIKNIETALKIQGFL